MSAEAIITDVTARMQVASIKLDPRAPFTPEQEARIREIVQERRNHIYAATEGVIAINEAITSQVAGETSARMAVTRSVGAGRLADEDRGALT